MSALEKTVRAGKEALRTGHRITIDSLGPDTVYAETSFQTHSADQGVHVQTWHPLDGTGVGETVEMDEAVGRMLELLCENHPHIPDDVFGHVVEHNRGVNVRFDRKEFPIDTVNTGTHTIFVDNVTREEMEEAEEQMQVKITEGKAATRGALDKIRTIQPVWKEILRVNDAYHTRKEIDAALDTAQ